MLANGSLTYSHPEGMLEASVLYNYFGERVRRYGQSIDVGTAFIRPPDVIELARGTLDAKLSVGITEHLSVSASARNLTDEQIRWVQPTSQAGRVTVSTEPIGVSGSVSLKYAF
jgi:hypothetical protein